MARFDALVLSCEHAGQRVPRELAARFAGAQRRLTSHRGWDPGALRLARALARATGAPLLATALSRLVVDANRSATNPAVFSRETRGLPRADRDRLLQRYHAPHRTAVTGAVAKPVQRGARVLHLAVHSFTPVLSGEHRNTDVAFLYDPKRAGERALCASWRTLLRQAAPELRVRRNFPYRGDADGLTSALRRRFPARRYLGIELELSQAHVRPDGSPDPALAALLVESLRQLRSRARARG